MLKPLTTTSILIPVPPLRWFCVSFSRAFLCICLHSEVLRKNDIYFQLYPKCMSALSWRFGTIICSKNVLSSRAFCLIGDFFFFLMDVPFSKVVIFFHFSFFHYVAGSVPVDLFCLRYSQPAQISPVPQRTLCPSCWIPGIISQFWVTPSFSTGLLQQATSHCT